MFLGTSPIIKYLIMDGLVGHMLKGLQYLHFTFGCTEMHVEQKRILLSLLGSGWGNSSVMSKVYQQCWEVGVLERVYQIMPHLPLD